MTMLRCGAEIVGYELREDFANRAVTNVRSFLGEDAARAATAWSCATATRASTRRTLDRVVLDLPEPWQVVPHCRAALRPGGILVAYTPSIMQAAQVREVARPARWINAAHPRGAPPRPGTSRAKPSAPTTAWSPTPAS